MRKKPSDFLILFFVFGLLGRIFAEDAQPTASKPVIVVEDLDGNKAGIPGWQPALGQAISEMLIESLEGSDGKFQVLETAEATGSQNEPKPGVANSAVGSAGSKRTAAGAASSMKTNADDTAVSEKPDAAASADSDFTFCGEVMQFMTQTNGSKLGDFISSSPFASLGAKVSTAHVQIEWRIVDTETKKVIKRGIAAASASGSEFDMVDLTTPDGKAAVTGSAAAFSKTAAGGKKGTNNYASLFSGLVFGNASANGGGSNGAAATKSAKASSTTAPQKAGGVAADGGNAIGESISYGDPTFMSSALGKATCKVITNIIEQLDAVNLPESGRVTKSKTASDALKHTPGKVLAVAGKDTIIVSLGSKEGLKEGDTLELYQPTDVKDDKGNVVFTDEKLVGEITLQSVQDDKSRASYSGGAQVQQGWTVKAK
ncbi:MAG TPA: FlgT C-terminal domain-containing protein [Verrucomicrobiae bacterium]|nr:FlgT C-terminal domain-containing protein [Verrucomicrobiae bacterium]